MHVLWIATKAPWPAIDGGRLVMALTLDALIAAGVDVTLVAPSIADGADAAAPEGVRAQFVDVRPRPWWTAGVSSLRSGQPLTIERHTHLAIAQRIEDLVRRERFDLVHVEQPQALPGAMPLIRTGMPCVLRAQNVESAIWSRLPRGRLVSPLLRAEGRRLRRFETAAVVMADVTIALSAADAAKLAALNPAARIIVIPPPGPRVMPASSSESGLVGEPPLASDPAAASDRALAGDPALVWIGSAGWPPNEEAGRWLLTEIWPAIAARLPQARLHLFGVGERESRGRGRGRGQGRGNETGSAAASVIAHAAPRESGEAFDPQSILLLPLRTPTGVRMRLLEAWARGMPVIASPAAVEGLETTDGEDVLIAASAGDFAECAARLATSEDLRTRVIHGGRATLARHHDPATVARATIDAYHDAIARQHASIANSTTSAAR
jgi:glycosyltransferase involved in cell wall biosynthesis